MFFIIVLLIIAFILIVVVASVNQSTPYDDISGDCLVDEDGNIYDKVTGEVLEEGQEENEILEEVIEYARKRLIIKNNKFVVINDVRKKYGCDSSQAKLIVNIADDIRNKEQLIKDKYFCPVCEKQIFNAKQLSNASFEDMPICKGCNAIIIMNRGGEEDGTVYLEDLQRIVKNYRKKESKVINKNHPH